MEQTSRENKRARTAANLVRLNVNLNTETADALRELADERGISVTEAVRRAISLYKYIEDETHDGRRIQVADRTGKMVSELVLI
jgi:hypothetical protein